jgi:hypothetical protein
MNKNAQIQELMKQGIGVGMAAMTGNPSGLMAAQQGGGESRWQDKDTAILGISLKEKYNGWDRSHYL